MNLLRTVLVTVSDDDDGLMSVCDGDERSQTFQESKNRS
jgi:hypothetical protein